MKGNTESPATCRSRFIVTATSVCSTACVCECVCMCVCVWHCVCQVHPVLVLADTQNHTSKKLVGLLSSWNLFSFLNEEVCYCQQLVSCTHVCTPQPFIHTNWIYTYHNHKFLNPSQGRGGCCINECCTTCLHLLIVMGKGLGLWWRTCFNVPTPFGHTYTAPPSQSLIPNTHTPPPTTYSPPPPPPFKY